MALVAEVEFAGTFSSGVAWVLAGWVVLSTGRGTAIIQRRGAIRSSRCRPGVRNCISVSRAVPHPVFGMAARVDVGRGEFKLGGVVAPRVLFIPLEVP